MDKAVIDIECRDFRNLRLTFANPAVRQHLFEVLYARTFPRFPQELFAFFYKPTYPNLGWETYNIENEFRRMQVPAHLWRVTQVNRHYAKSSTYPPLLMVPNAIDDSKLDAVFTFRSKGRIPTLTYYHHNGATITRSSQPMVGITKKRCLEDEELLEAIRACNFTNSSVLYLFDARPRANAIANQAMGKGFENVAEGYRNCKLEFLNIENIHVMRESQSSLQRLLESTIDDDRTWLSGLEATNWLAHIKMIMVGAYKVGRLIDRDGASVLVHCSDGWDRTAQITALAQLLLNPYYRTIVGFEVLIEKDWMSFGHKFARRIGHGDRSYTDSQRAPIFLQFIDCVWQLLQQFPCSFEFSDKLLITILDQLYHCQFGSFLFNSNKQRDYANLKRTTISMWSYIHSDLERYYNPFYLPGTGVLQPSVHMDAIQLWRAYYLRHYRPENTGGITVDLRAWQLKVSYETARDRVQALERELESLQQQVASQQQQQQDQHEPHHHQPEPHHQQPESQHQQPEPQHQQPEQPEQVAPTAEESMQSASSTQHEGKVLSSSPADTP
jgi:myotubularin-related protein 1/2